MLVAVVATVVGEAETAPAEVRHIAVKHLQDTVCYNWAQL